VALVVFTAATPRGDCPIRRQGRRRLLRGDPLAPDQATLEAAVRLARLLAMQTLRDHDVEVDAAAVAEALKGVREQLETLRLSS